LEGLLIVCESYYLFASVNRIILVPGSIQTV